ERDRVVNVAAECLETGGILDQLQHNPVRLVVCVVEPVLTFDLHPLVVRVNRLGNQVGPAVDPAEPAPVVRETVRGLLPHVCARGRAPTESVSLLLPDLGGFALLLDGGGKVPAIHAAPRSQRQPFGRLLWNVSHALPPPAAQLGCPRPPATVRSCPRRKRRS